MKNLSKKLIALVLIFIILMAFFMPSMAKATTTTTDATEYKFLEGTNQTYIIGVDEIETFRLSSDFSLF